MAPLFKPLVEHCLRVLALDDAMELLAALCSLDRYQASCGIEAAATMVADAAVQVGVEDIEIHRFPVDGTVHWWTFRAPSPWTPVTAKLEIIRDDETVVPVTEYPADRCSLATYSAPLLSSRIFPLRVIEEPDDRLGGAVVLAPCPRPSLRSDCRRLELIGASGIVTDATARGEDGEYPGRLELDQDSGLFGFCVSRTAMAALRANCPGQVRVRMVVQARGGMPITTALLPGRRAEEVWLLAHLCHPGPGANDNASGVAALVGLIACLERMPAELRTFGIRLLWMPEFVGTVAFLAARAERGLPLPRAVLNLDMVGQDQVRCRAPLVVERPPSHIGNSVAALAERAIELVATVDRVPSGWSWRSSPFAGMSDHMIFADRRFARPSVFLGHPADRFNHSAGDRIDNVDPTELRRVAAATAATAILLTHDLPGRGRELRDGLAAPRQRNANLSYIASSTTRDVGREPMLVRKWDGPCNVRGLLHDAPPDARDWLVEAIAADKSMYSVVLCMLLGVDDRSDAAAIRRRAARSLGREVLEDVANRVLDAALAAGWLEEQEPLADV